MTNSIKTNEFLQAVHSPAVTKEWVTADLKEMGYIATLMVPVVKLGLTDGTIKDAQTVRMNQFRFQVHLTKEQAKVLMNTLKHIIQSEDDK